MLAELADAEPVAAELLAEVVPIARPDLAIAVQGQHPWPDTFALWWVARSPRTLAQLHSVAVALATAYSASVVKGAVLDLRFPFHEIPLARSSTLGRGRTACWWTPDRSCNGSGSARHYRGHVGRRFAVLGWYGPLRGPGGGVRGRR